MNTITFPDGRQARVDWAGRTTLSKLSVVNQYPDLFYDDPGEGIFITDDTDVLLDHQELGFEFSWEI